MRSGLAGRQQGVWGDGSASGMREEGPTQNACGGQGTREGAHIEHAEHGCDAEGVPAGNVRVEVLQLIEEGAHVGDGRDVPVGDGAVRRSGGSRVSVVRFARPSLAV